MANQAVKFTFDKCEEKHPHETVKANVAEFDETRKAMRITVNKGFRWTNCMKEKMGTDFCMADHFGFLQKGKMKVWMNGGNEIDVAEGDCYHIPPGHDAEMLEDVVMIEFSSAAVGMYGKDIK